MAKNKRKDPININSDITISPIFSTFESDPISRKAKKVKEVDIADPLVVNSHTSTMGSQTPSIISLDLPLIKSYSSYSATINPVEESNIFSSGLSSFFSFSSTPPGSQKPSRPFSLSAFKAVSRNYSSLTTQPQSLRVPVLKFGEVIITYSSQALPLNTFCSESRINIGDLTPITPTESVGPEIISNPRTDLSLKSTVKMNKGINTQPTFSLSGINIHFTYNQDKWKIFSLKKFKCTRMEPQEVEMKCKEIIKKIQEQASKPEEVIVSDSELPLEVFKKITKNISSDYLLKADFSKIKLIKNKGSNNKAHAHIIKDFLDKNSDLEILILNKFEIGSLTVQLMSRISGFYNLKELYLNGIINPRSPSTQYGDSLAKNLAELIASGQITILEAGDNFITSIGAKKIADSLKDDLHLQKLVLKGNSIQKEGIEYLANILKLHNQTLTCLDVSKQNKAHKKQVEKSNLASKNELIVIFKDVLQNNINLIELNFWNENASKNEKFIKDCLARNALIKASTTDNSSLTVPIDNEGSGFNIKSVPNNEIGTHNSLYPSIELGGSAEVEDGINS